MKLIKAMIASGKKGKRPANARKGFVDEIGQTFVLSVRKPFRRWENKMFMKGYEFPKD